MTRLIICGQAPSRVGDGRAFSGPSGQRLARLLDLEDYEHLASQVTLVNLLDHPAERQEHRGDHFDLIAAVQRAQALLRVWTKEDDKVAVVACGHQVYRCFIGRQGIFFSGARRRRAEVWCFPHPSGASAFWNDPVNRDRAAEFLKRLLDRYGIALTE